MTVSKATTRDHQTLRKPAIDMSTLQTTPPKPHDQARTLRTMIEQHAAVASLPRVAAARGQTIAVISGKGGVGKSVIALNLAVCLAQQGKSVCLLDASLGLGSLDLMCGLNGYWNLSHVISGARELHEAILAGPAGIRLIPGASGLSELSQCPLATQQRLLDQLHALEQQHDVLIVDTGSGIHRLARQFALSADRLVVVTTPEPTAITDAYATIKSLCAAGMNVGLVVNQVDTGELALKIGDRLKQTARMFLQTDLEFLGCIPRDAAVPQSILKRQPLAVSQPNAAASRAFTRLAMRCGTATGNSRTTEAFFARLSRSLQRAA